MKHCMKSFFGNKVVVVVVIIRLIRFHTQLRAGLGKEDANEVEMN